MGTNCSSCGCTDQQEFKTDEVFLEDLNKRNQNVGVMQQTGKIAGSKQPDVSSPF